MNRLRIPALLAIAALAACGSADGFLSSRPENAAPQSIFSQNLLLTFDSKGEIDFKPGAGAGFLQLGCVLLFDPSVQVFVCQDSVGTPLLKFGRRGGGPGEFTRVLTFSVVGGDQVFVSDPGLRRITQLSSNLQHVRDIAWPSGVGMVSAIVSGDSAGLVLATFEAKDGLSEIARYSFANGGGLKKEFYKPLPQGKPSELSSPGRVAPWRPALVRQLGNGQLLSWDYQGGALYLADSVGAPWRKLDLPEMPNEHVPTRDGERVENALEQKLTRASGQKAQLELRPSGERNVFLAGAWATKLCGGGVFVPITSSDGSPTPLVFFDRAGVAAGGALLSGRLAATAVNKDQALLVVESLDGTGYQLESLSGCLADSTTK